MRRNTLFITIIGLIGACGGNALAQDYFDDVYYNPKKDTSSTKVTKTSAPAAESYYITNFGDIDVDAYNRRGEQYYVSEIDTIGSRVENGEDFVYTQQIQKFYNPTIVVDNSNLLGDILANSRGNVEIVINDYGNPVFAPYSYYNWNWPYYSYAWSPWNWNFSIGSWGWNFGWGPSWAWGPSWNWGPSWGWGPGWSWGWAPPRPHPAPGWRPGPMATWSPGGNRPAAPRPGWNAPARPGASPANRPLSGVHRSPQPGNSASQPVQGARPGSSFNSNASSNHRAPVGSGVIKGNDGRWHYNTSTPSGSASGAHRSPSGIYNPGSNGGTVSTSRPGVTTTRPSVGTSQGSRPSTGTVSRPASSSSNKSNSNVSRPSTPNRSTGSYNRSSSSGNRSVGGGGRSVGGGSRSGGGGGGGGRHR